MLTICALNARIFSSVVRVVNCYTSYYTCMLVDDSVQRLKIRGR